MTQKTRPDDHWTLEKLRSLLGFILRILIACGTAMMISGCLPLMAASAAGSVIYYNMPHSNKNAD
ncbi:hypothetical protein HER14_01290 [Acidithiobacillus thiooxidans]|jgi:hypothetical protein|uniref:Uncharacterized protein n=1 Tax=Acidithiobacillus thiooxidans TaxID=930 RepID=A0A1C2J1K9_ACITH|nr:MULTISPECIES: hypothetical protein [Acidithiobacillus]MBE7563916.1 hypothetical protein [Acidithiobacillus sp. HP-6]MBE7569753.1 hypothetical protein [Acidithiobacillus sp. HP-2]MBU2749637.1 hypothetical protein [Acidithiobacillus thiooxidans]OCX68922.1 hypothetical protein A6M23_16525 [Acidithiobacillus thiooxidans]OCX82124.1 hypothetical protein A6P08_12625 [Acidithiobacillus thiooxidans]